MNPLMQNAIELVQCMRITALVTWGVAVLALKARILSRAISRAGLWWDDWLLVPAIVSRFCDLESIGFTDHNQDSGIGHLFHHFFLGYVRTTETCYSAAH